MDHPFFVQGEGWVEVADMGPGDQLVSADGAPMLVKSIEAEGYTATTYNLTVANALTFFVGEERVWRILWSRAPSLPDLIWRSSGRNIGYPDQVRA